MLRQQTVAAEAAATRSFSNTKTGNEGVKMANKLKKLIDDFLKKLAKENEKSFGSERLDCCKLDRPKDDQTK